MFRFHCLPRPVLARCAMLAAAVFLPGILSAPAAADYAFNYGPVNDPIVSASLHIDVAAMTAHRSVFETEVNFVRLVDVNGSQGTLDLSESFFGNSSFPGPAVVDQGVMETGVLSASIDSSFFPALASGTLGLWALLTDTGDGMFAIDDIALEIDTTSGSIISTYGSTNNGFGLGIPDGGNLPAPLPGPIPFGTTGTGFDETITSKSIYLVPAPPAALVLLGGLVLGRTRRRRALLPVMRARRSRAGLGVLLLCIAASPAAFAQTGPDPALPCAIENPTPDAGCLETKPRAVDLVTTIEDDTLPPEPYDPFDPENWRWVLHDLTNAQTTTFPVDPKFVPIDPDFVGQTPGATGCAANICGGSIATIFGTDDRVRINDTTQEPYCRIGQIYAYFSNNRRKRGTGALVGSRHLLTAAHVVIENGEFCSSLNFYPAQNGTSFTSDDPAAYPYGVSNGTYVYSYFGFTSRRLSECDIALVVLDRNIGDRAGWFGKYTVVDNQRSLHLSGYPHDKPAGTQWYGTGPVGNTPNFLIEYTIDTFEGQSGAPVWQNYDDGRFIVGVHRGGPNTTVNHAVRITKGNFDNINAWIAAHPPLLAGADPCADCGPDCNHNDVADDIDIATGFSLDVNRDGIPDECQPDQLHLFGPMPNPVPAGSNATIQAVVERQFAPLADRVVGFKVISGSVTFVDGGVIEPDARSITAASDSSGHATITFKADDAGAGTTALIQASCSDAPLAAYVLVQISNPITPPKPGDVNSDGIINVADLLAVISAWGPCPPPPPPPGPGACAADVTGDGMVTVADLLVVINNWG